MKVLVTGGAGYIGSHVTELLIERGHQVVVYDNLVAGHRAAVHPHATFVHGDLLDQEQLTDLFASHTFDGVMHFASHILVGESMQNPWKYLRDNVAGTTNLLEAVASAHVRRFILSSTANLFDKPQHIPINEDEPLIPGSVYGETKFIAERMLMWMDKLYELKYCCLRYFNASGAHPKGHIGEDHYPETHLIPIVLQVALGQRDHLTIYGSDYNTPDGTCIRDYIHVLDLGEAHIMALEALADGRSRVYNLGSGSGYSVLEVVETARAVTGHPIPLQYGQRRSGDVDVLVADSSRIKQELGWSPKYDHLQRIVETAWNWHKNHPYGFGDRKK
ncbi:MAG: UDP-glucose 4-epimerase GalE [Chloroflexi bacterium]|nr:UDP-glucose 4-epimerase GalE [Chloroflexota bacterium]